MSADTLPEKEIQKAVMRHWRLRGARNTRLAAIRNESAAFKSRHHVRAALSTGLTPGMPDLIVVGPERSQVRFLELKTDTGRLSPEQERIHHEFRNLGVEVEVAWSLDEALKTLERWGVLRPAIEPRAA